LFQSQQVQLRWQVASVEDGKARTVATFSPTDDFVTLLPYFDQYSRSLTFWSPDSRHFVYTQDENSSGGSVWVADVSGTTPPLKIGEGTIAVWSWK
jgi:TolB protein